MQKKNKIIASSLLIVALALVSVVVVNFFLLEPPQNEVVVILPLPNETSYTQEVNQWLAEKQVAHVVAESTKTPDKEVKKEAFLLRLISKAEAAVKDIYFYGKIVDQYGNPVPGVVVKYKAQSQYLAAGTGFGKTTTDEDGRFNTRGAEGVGLSIRKFIKPGYQFSGIQDFDNFQRFEHSILWRDFTIDSPYVFKAWKVDRYPEVNTGGTTFGFDLGELYSMDFTAPYVTNVKHKKKLDLDLQVRFDRDDAGWRVKLLVPDGGLIETDDLFMNLAPEEGYRQEINYSGPKEKYISIKKKYYIHSRGKFYGYLSADIRPYHRNKAMSAIRFRYVMNLENGRELTVRETRYVY